ncbi:hypothetical protein L2E82_16735 [Cichorium intybus]|uniref:Uncharacterized protein n=1 Tax=Cichorium intybus TaxID=13427 RepID=A0ACB9F6Z2_CICIN|nr:hypothetical protein L2E82_16735 [Cichorium intybus]
MPYSLLLTPCTITTKTNDPLKYERLGLWRCKKPTVKVLLSPTVTGAIVIHRLEHRLLTKTHSFQFLVCSRTDLQN